MSDLTNLATLGGTTSALLPEEQRVLTQLIQQYSTIQHRNALRTLYLDGERSLRRAGKLGMALPPQLGQLESVLGWPAKAVEVMDNRLDLQGFVTAGQAEVDESVESIAIDNDLYNEARLVHTAAMTHGCAFITIFAGDTTIGEPEVVITTRSAEEATALWSQRSRRVVAGMTINAGLEGLESDQINLFMDDRVVSIWRENGRLAVQRQPHDLGEVPMVMLPYRPRLKKRFGISRISRPLMDLTDSAVRTVLRMEGTAEFFSFPQRWATGVDSDDFDDTFKTYLNRILALGADEDGNQPQLGTFTAASPQPHIDQLRATAMLVSGETSIPPNYLGIIQDNPASADAIRAAEADLVKGAERAQATFDSPWCNAIRIAQKMRDGFSDDRLRKLKTKWRDASTPTKAADAQSVMTLVGAGVLPAQSEVTWELLGYDPVTISRLKATVAENKSLGAPDPVPKFDPNDPSPIAPKQPTQEVGDEADQDSTDQSANAVM